MPAKHFVFASLATPADVGAIARMSRDEIETGLEWKYTPERIRYFLKDSDTMVLCMRYHHNERARSQLLGFGIMQLHESSANVVLLAVSKSVRRRGLGRSILAWLEKSALTAGMEKIVLEVRRTNMTARHFYDALGFKVVAQIHNYYRTSNGHTEDALRLVKSIRISMDEWLEHGSAKWQAN